LGKRYFKTAQENSSISENPKDLNPSGSHATDVASIPENTDK
jgi:hypothetical protein